MKSDESVKAPGGSTLPAKSHSLADILHGVVVVIVAVFVVAIVVIVAVLLMLLLLAWCLRRMNHEQDTHSSCPVQNSVPNLSFTLISNYKKI